MLRGGWETCGVALGDSGRGCRPGTLGLGVFVVVVLGVVTWGPCQGVLEVLVS